MRDAVGADLLQLAGLHEAQQQPLHPQGHLADFVEEDGAAVGELELADLVAIGAREGALDVAEQLRFEQRFRKAGAVHGDQLPRGARAAPVDGAGDELLADAALAGDQDLGVGPRDPLDLLDQLDDRGARADQFTVALRSHSCVSRDRSPHPATGPTSAPVFAALQKLLEVLPAPVVHRPELRARGPTCVRGHRLRVVPLHRDLGAERLRRRARPATGRGCRPAAVPRTPPARPVWLMSSSCTRCRSSSRTTLVRCQFDPRRPPPFDHLAPCLKRPSGDDCRVAVTQSRPRSAPAAPTASIRNSRPIR